MKYWIEPEQNTHSITFLYVFVSQTLVWPFKVFTGVYVCSLVDEIDQYIVKFGTFQDFAYFVLMLIKIIFYIYQ